MSLITDEKRSLFHSYASEFEKNYLLEPAGQRHLALYRKEKDEVTRFWAEIKKAKQAGKQITDLVLQKLLPYSNTRHNREKNYRISVAPAITKDLMKWFENAGWQQHDNWDNVAMQFTTSSMVLSKKIIGKVWWLSRKNNRCPEESKPDSLPQPSIS